MKRETFGRLLALITALTAWFGLVLQLWLIIVRLGEDGHDAWFAVWRFLGFFTILTNCAVAIVSSLMASGQLRPVGPRLRLAVAASILFVGVVYSIALRSQWNPQGWQAVADHVLHDAVPLLFFAAWLAAAHVGLRWSDAFIAALWPAAYCAYAFVRGAADGWYAYWFLDPSRMSVGQMMISLAALLCAVIAIGALLVALDRRLAHCSFG